MTDTILDFSTCVPPPAESRADVIRDALQESRQRWRQLVGLAADLAFETDAKGRFVFVLPAGALGWPNGSLVGQPSELLLGDGRASPVLNPFRSDQELRRCRAYIRRYDGTLAMLAISASPLRGPNGEMTGTRGIGIDMTEYDTETAIIARRLRRGEMLDHILSRLAQQGDVDRMMDTALATMVQALEAEGAAVIATLASGAAMEPLHECGPGADAVLDLASRSAAEPGAEARTAVNIDGRHLLSVACPCRIGANVGLAIWRNPDGRAWDSADAALAVSAAGIVRMILDHEAVHREMARQARTDTLTGLLNRRAFLDDMKRDFYRLDRESQPGTLINIDIDAFQAVNDRLGQAMGDAVLVCLADLLRELVRPSDLIARLGGDEFAVWLSGADHMTAAERSDHLCKTAPSAFALVVQQDIPGLGVSVGLATRRIGSIEPVQDLCRRADAAISQVKRSGRGHWRVSLLEGDS